MAQRERGPSSPLLLPGRYHPLPTPLTYAGQKAGVTIETVGYSDVTKLLTLLVGGAPLDFATLAGGIIATLGWKGALTNLTAYLERDRELMREVRWERMFPDELEQAFAACPLLYFTYGLCEPHGPHNALGLDELKAHGLACAAAHSTGGIVAPPSFWHIHGFGGYNIWAERMVGETPRPWLSCVPPWVFFRNVCYQVRTADMLGFHAALFITGHYGRHSLDFKRLVELLQPHVGTRLFFLQDSEANRPGFDSDGKSSGDHAGKVETSLLWALEPDCVDVSRLPPPGTPIPQFGMGPTAHQSNRLVGERMAADIVRNLGAKGQELLAEYDRLQPRHTFRTFADVEEFWSAEVQPKLGQFACMQESWDGSPAPSVDSVWRENWQVSGQ